MPTVLVVEDDNDSRELASRVLEARGFAVLRAPDAATGLRLAVENNPDAIVMDLGLPDADGQTLVAWLRRMPNLAQIPIIACTAWPEETARLMVGAYGCTDYIRKPINIGQFAEQISRHLPKST